MTININSNERIDDLQRNGYRIIQNPSLFCFGMDAVLLSAFAKVKKDEKVLDFCTGNGVIPILLEARTKGSHYTGLEIQDTSADLAMRSVMLNNLGDKIDIVKGNVVEASDIFKGASFNVITCNPPYFKKKDDSIINDNKIKSIARHEIEMELEDVMIISKALLKNEGSLVLVHRTDRLIEIIELMKKHNIEPKRMRLIYPKVNAESNLVLIDGRKNGKEGLKILPPLYIHNDDNSYTSEVLEMFGK